MSEELVSIIIPVYNCEKYIGDCLTSIVSQSYQHLEVIIVDDESTDKSADICEQFAKQYNFIKIIRQKNAGSGMARNRGLESVSGSYYTFVDSDDYISETFIEDLLSASIDNDAELAECGNVYMLEARDILKNTDHRVYTLESNEEILDHEKEHRNTVWGRLYKTEKFRDLRFSDRMLGEDAEYSQKVITMCNKMVHYNYCLYGYRSYQESVTRPVINNELLRKLGTYALAGNEMQFEKSINKLIDPVIHRNEEKLYFGKISKMYDIYHKSTFYSDSSDICQKLSKALARGRCSYMERIYLRFRHSYAQLMSRYRIKVNYKYKLDT